MSEWWRKISARRRGQTFNADLEEEMRTHMEMKAAKTGDADEARRQFGNTTLLLEDARAAWGWPNLEAWLRDFRYAFRALRKRPGFASTIVLTLALGIGAAAAIFSLIDTVLIRPLPYPDADRLVAINEANLSDRRSIAPVAPGRLVDWQRLTTTFSGIAGSGTDTLTDTTGTAPERLSAAFVSPQFFAVAGAAPELGRVFTPEEERYGGPLAIVISDAFWRRRFAADASVLERSLILDQKSYLVVGVMPPWFQLPANSLDVWTPKQASAALLDLREARFYNCIGRLKPGATINQAQADLASIQARLADLYPRSDSGWSVVMEPLKDRLVGNMRLALWFLLGAVSLLLLIACANVACLLLARLDSRTAELATRCSLGAGRAAIARQLFAEALVYAFTGGALGVAAAFAAIDAFRRQLAEIPRIGELTLDPRVVALSAAISILAAVLFSLAPMLQTFRRDLTGALIRGGRTLVGSRQRLPRLLVFTQLALATALLIGAGLLLKSLLRLEQAPLGFRSADVLTLRVGASYKELPDATIQMHQRILDALSSIPGVSAAAMSSGLPGIDPTWQREFVIAGEPAPYGALRFAGWRIVTSTYFQTVGIPILEGQTCRMSTEPQRPFEALVNRSFVDRYFHDRTALGHSITGGPQGNSISRIVGIVGDAREDGRGAATQPLIYACGYLRYWPDSDFLVQARDPAALSNAVREAVHNVEPLRPVYSVRTLTAALDDSLLQTRFRALLLTLFSLAALMLAAIGLYGVMAYMVSQRTREIGIRLALGARPRQIVGEIVRSGGILALAGAAAGILLAVAASRVLGALLYGVHSSDLVTFVSATALLLAVALLASLIPSKRATSIDPNQALRQQ